MSKDHYPMRPARHAGVTLIELAITIALVGVLAVLIVQFVTPVRSYIDASRRAALADTADIALRRIGRDLRLALPNSVRVSGKYVEFLLVRTGGRYRADTGSTATLTCNDGLSTAPANDLLSFSGSDSCFRSIGSIPNYSQITLSPSANLGDFLVVFNLPPGTTTGTPNANAYEFPGTGGNKSRVLGKFTGTNEDGIIFDPNTFTYESPGNRFFIVEGPVTYGCAGGVLTRYWNYTISSSQVAPPSGGSSAVIATGVTDCSFVYDTSIAAQGAGLVTMSLQLNMQDTRGTTETVSLYHSVHVNNQP
jgi:MSHA biogenesis protein MshO